MEPLGNHTVQDYNAADKNGWLYETTLFLQNQQSKTSDSLTYSKVGDTYFISGALDFTTVEMDVLPEEASTDGFIMDSTGEVLTIAEGSSILTAQTTGSKVITGFYFA